MSEAVFQQVRVMGKMFEGCSVVLDNMWFENCSIENCEIFYSGGPTETRSCRFENVRWCFQGPAALTVKTIRKLGWQVNALE